jgi:hypothetical protein
LLNEDTGHHMHLLLHLPGPRLTGHRAAQPRPWTREVQRAHGYLSTSYAVLTTAPSGVEVVLGG